MTASFGAPLAPKEVIALDDSDDEEGEAADAGYGGGGTRGGTRGRQQRLLRLLASGPAARRDVFTGDLPPHFRLVEAESSASGADGGDASRGSWLQLWAEQGDMMSRVYHVCVMDASELEECMRRVVGGMASHDADAIANIDASDDLARAASRVASLVLQRAPASSAAPVQSSMGTGPAARGRRPASSPRPADRRMLLLTGLESMRRRLGRGEAGVSERRFMACAMALAQATILAIVAEHAAWHVHVAPTAKKADVFLEAILRVVDRDALLDRSRHDRTA